ncbi:MAG: PQQ-binding-like beta-propeller repeat protein [Verrucomicrobiota bacterium]
MKFPGATSHRVFGSLLIGTVVHLATPVPAANWPGWRGGVDGSGIAAEQHAPVEWSAAKNVRWKVALPNRGNSTPIVWGDRVFVTQVVEAENFRTLMCFDRGDGKLLWQKGVTYTKPERTHKTNPYCSASPATDGERVVVTFASAGVYCYDFNGKELWKKDLGPQDHEWGNSSSPVIHGDICYVYHGPGDDAFLVALNKKDGRELWRYQEPPVKPGPRTDGFRDAREVIDGSFSTPIIVKANGRDELIMSFPQEVRALDPKTGQVLWHCAGLNPLIYTSPIYGDGVVVAMGGFLGTTIAVKAGGNGDVTGTHRLWIQERTKNRLGSGVIHNGHIYILNTDGIAECLELKTGKTLWEERLRGTGPRSESWSSMTLVSDRIYIPNQFGDTLVLRASPKFELLATNPVKEPTNSSLVLSNGEFFLRTHNSLWCISEVKSASSQ